MLGRTHSFSTSAAVMSELSPLAEALAPLDVRGIPGAIPIMTMQDGLGRRRLLEEVQSNISGCAIRLVQIILSVRNFDTLRWKLNDDSAVTSQHWCMQEH